MRIAIRAAVVVLLGLVPMGYAQTADSAQQAAGKLEFDVASVRQNKAEGKPGSNIPLGPQNIYGPSGGVVSAKDFTLLYYMTFAYKLTDYQQEELRSKAPGWVLNDRFNIEARTDDRDVTKDELRRMMQSLLADRFKLAVHYEPRTVSVYALKLVKPGVTGAKLKAHPSNAVCPGFSPLVKTAEGKPIASLPDAAADGFPTFCGGLLDVPASAQDRYSFGARDVTMGLMASALSSWGNLGRPVVDATGLGGTWDFVVDYTPDPRPKYATVDSGGPTFREALQKQLGLKLEAKKAPVPFMVLDHVERLTQN
ncbi:MAG: TIGR03435 family protein [Acidobacteriota bacterium]|nr:TIGR03435 family protein [Acidobacteriota bacterium]